MIKTTQRYHVSGTNGRISSETNSNMTSSCGYDPWSYTGDGAVSVTDSEEESSTKVKGK